MSIICFHCYNKSTVFFHPCLPVSYRATVYNVQPGLVEHGRYAASCCSTFGPKRWKSLAPCSPHTNTGVLCMHSQYT